MSEIAIRAEGLSKQYRIGTGSEKYKTLRDTLVNNALAPFRWAGDMLRGQGKWQAGSRQTFWALRDVSFEIKRGEVVGVIGANGAGKTTLLKILSRITEPTAGYADVYGRVGSLLEVGTGFHPELTGRENLFLNGAILGMRRREIERKFDEIVDFAEVERFIDTPVKRYSSGMYLRLAFAVAAHLEPDILLVDEVLAVGDAAFQKKSLGKMGSFAQEGRTVFFVTHNMDAIQRLCDRVFWLDDGSVAYEGVAYDAVSRYLSSSSSMTYGSAIINPRAQREGSGKARFSRITVEDEKGATDGHVILGTSITVHLAFEVFEALNRPFFSIGFDNQLHQRIATVNTDAHSVKLPPSLTGGKVQVSIDSLNLMPGTYHLTIGLGSAQDSVDWVSRAVAIEVLSPGDMDGRLPPRRSGFVFLPGNWKHSYS